MAKFLFVYRNALEVDQKQPSPEEMQQFMDAWHAWFAKVGAGLVDGGDGLLPTGKIVKPTGVVTDGPFIEGKDIVGGYSIVQADTYDQAVEYAKSCPIIMVGGSIEVRELAGLG